MRKSGRGQNKWPVNLTLCARWLRRRLSGVPFASSKRSVNTTKLSTFLKCRRTAGGKKKTEARIISLFLPPYRAHFPPTGLLLLFYSIGSETNSNPDDCISAVFIFFTKVRLEKPILNGNFLKVFIPKFSVRSGYQYSLSNTDTREHWT